MWVHRFIFLDPYNVWSLLQANRRGIIEAVTVGLLPLPSLRHGLWGQPVNT